MDLNIEVELFGIFIVWSEKPLPKIPEALSSSDTKQSNLQVMSAPLTYEQLLSAR